jgi:hypothetical protein
VFVQEHLPEGVPPGVRDAVWDDKLGALRIPLLHSNTMAKP